MERRLAAILTADVVGYSRLMAADEAGTLAALKAQRRELVEPKLAGFGGRIVKLMGDGVLIEFASVVDAVSFAVQVQGEVGARNAALPEDRRLAYRVGINIGDVIVDGEDIYGDGVNIAARLEALAEPGGICVSQNVYNQVRTKLDLAFEDLGDKPIKNIPEPVRVYALRPDGAADALPTAPLPALPDKPSIAVLAFDNLSGDPEQGYFVDGIAEDIITELSREPDLFVIARNSSFAYKGQSPDIRRVAAELGVRFVLEGSVRKAGQRIRLTAQLIDAANGHHLWAERYDRALEDVFELQDELTNTIQNSLLQKVREIDIGRAQARAPKDLDAYDHMLRGFGLLLKFDRASNLEAIREAEAALARDPDYARAHMTLAWAHLYQVWSAWSDDVSGGLERGRQAAQAAIAADRNDFWGYSALGFAELFAHRQEAALAALERALTLNPNSADVHMMRGMVLNFLGRPEEGLAEVERAIRHNPHHPDWYLIGVARSHYLLGDYEAAALAARRLVTVTPDMALGRLLLAASLVASGQAEAARAEMAACLERSPTLDAAHVAQIVPFQQDADLQRYLDYLRQAGLPG